MSQAPSDSTAEPEQPPLRSVHTTSFPPLLRQLGISLMITTYQAGKLVIVRDDGDHLNTHFRDFQVPMGLALAGDRLAIGARFQIWEFHNVPAAAEKLKPEGRHDACFLPRSCHVTGNVRIHEMAWGHRVEGGGSVEGRGWKVEGDQNPSTPSTPSSSPSTVHRPPSTHEPSTLPPSPSTHEPSTLHRPPSTPELWFVNTRFSCLCTIDRIHSFVARWRPPFVSVLTPEDRCHLNGLTMVDGQPQYVTALGESDEPAGWRANKANGGVLIDVASGETIARGLSMPHSPRWYAGRLWLLESGTGTFGSVDPATGQYEPVATLPGFTRGLDFYGNCAFIGLSQVRETAVFSGIPITENQTERNCGVWVVDIRNGQIIAFLRFEDALQEIFAVQVVAGRRYPDLIIDDQTLLDDSFVLTDEALRAVPEPLKKLSRDLSGN